MSAFGELFGAARLRKESTDDQGTGERFDHGPLDLDSGIVAVRPPAPVTPPGPGHDGDARG